MKVLLDPEGKEVTHGAEEALTPSGTLKAKWKQFGYSMQFVGYPYTRVKFVAFNPASRAHIANRLTTLYGWEPQEFTPGGDPKIDETVLEGLDYPTAPLLNTYFLVQKRLGQLAEGNQAWLKVMRDGRIHGSINPNGAVTGRATHSFPNVAQVPSVKKDKEDNILLGLDGGYGHECRELFGVPEGWTQVGTDMSGLELRCLSHFMARWDGGEYGRILLTGDIHTANQQAAGLDTRNQAKTFAYAYLYGAGDAKLGSITGGGTKEGKRLRANFQAKIPALGKLTDAVKKKAKSGHLKGLDGRLLYVRSEHSALNTLLQSAGALICKKWLVLMDEHLLARGYKHGWDGDYAFLAWVHDEVQIAARTPALAAEITDLSKQCAREAEAFFGFRIQLDTDSKIGSSWAECH
jgi:DNA polymerase I-like protein with 3'-5' exonuclease and polymerase domains